MELLKQRMKATWYELLKEYFEGAHFPTVLSFLNKRKKIVNIYPEEDKVFTAFNQFELYDLKVVVLGQDPYHTVGVANGLAFSNAKADYIPPSLRNIISEAESDLGGTVNSSTFWSEALAKQGVLLLNTALTVEENSPMSHHKLWETFTNFAIKQISEATEKVIFVLWGNHAQLYIPLIDQEKHFIIKAAHPSPLSATRGFFGSKPFSKVNEILSSLNKQEIAWLT